MSTEKSSSSSSSKKQKLSSSSSSQKPRFTGVVMDVEDSGKNASNMMKNACCDFMWIVEGFW